MFPWRDGNLQPMSMYFIFMQKCQIHAKQFVKCHVVLQSKYYVTCKEFHNSHFEIEKEHKIVVNSGTIGFYFHIENTTWNLLKVTTFSSPSGSRGWSYFRASTLCEIYRLDWFSHVSCDKYVPNTQLITLLYITVIISNYYVIE